MGKSATKPAAEYSQPGSQPARSIKRDPKQEAAARAEADQEARNALAAVLAAERRARLTAGSRGEITATDGELIFTRLSTGHSVETIAAELKIAADILSAWILNPDRDERRRNAFMACAHHWGTKIAETACDLRIPALERRVMIEGMQWAAAKLGREFFGDKVQVQADVRVQHVVDSSALDPEQRDELRRILRLAIEQARDQGRVIEHQSGED